MNLHQPDAFDALMQDVLHEYANPAAPDGLANRTTHRSLTMHAAIAPRTAPSTAHSANASPDANLLTFRTFDRAATGRRMSPHSVGIAILFNVAALLLLMVQIRSARLAAPTHLDMISLEAPSVPPPAPPKSHAMGGGGGQPGAASVSRGNPPKFAAEQLNPPKAPPLVEPKIRIESTVDVQRDLKMATVDVPNFGMPNSPLVGTSLGNGHGVGIGSGSGPGIGAGTGGNNGGGLRRIGGGVLPPQVIFAPEPEFSEEARKAKVSGNVLVYLQVDVNGHPTHIRVLRGIGLGLDQKAIEAVARYKFKPAMEDGHPVPVEMNVDVDFHIF